MAVRPIDGNVLIERFRPYSHTGEAIPADVVIEDIRSMPTLTPQNKWMKVDENLPDFDVPVLVYVKDIFDNKSIINITKYTITYDLTNNWLGYENSSFKITHWMPLPEPPTMET